LRSETWPLQHVLRGVAFSTRRVALMPFHAIA
jgi:hypothetical protein